MLYWTKNKPTSAGPYWIKLSNNHTEVVTIYIVDGQTCLIINDEVRNVNELYLANVLWSNGKVPEPVGPKI